MIVRRFNPSTPTMPLGSSSEPPPEGGTPDPQDTRAASEWKTAFRVLGRDMAIGAAVGVASTALVHGATAVGGTAAGLAARFVLTAAAATATAIDLEPTIEQRFGFGKVGSYALGAVLGAGMMFIGTDSVSGRSLAADTLGGGLMGLTWGLIYPHRLPDQGAATP